MRPNSSYNHRQKYPFKSTTTPTQPTTAPSGGDEANAGKNGRVINPPQSPRSSSSYSRYKKKGIKQEEPERISQILNNQPDDLNPLSHLLQSRIRAASASATHRPTLASATLPLPSPSPFPPYPSPPTAAPHRHPLTSTTTTFSSFSPPYGTESISQDSELFSHMTLDDALLYLTQHPHCQYLHVTPASSVNKYLNTTFYDLIILERPGYPYSGYVWSKSDRRREHLLHEHLMQLSLTSLLYIDEFHGNVSLPLTQFLEERELVRQLRQKKFFRYHLELKVMTYWTGYVQRVRFARKKNELETKSFFADPPLIAGRLYIHSITHSLHETIDLFAAPTVTSSATTGIGEGTGTSGRTMIDHGNLSSSLPSSGAINLIPFLTTQIQQIHHMTDLVRQSILNLYEEIILIHNTLISDDYLAKDRQSIITHHPYSKGLKVPNQPLDSEGKIKWDEVRAIQRLKNEGFLKIVRLLVLGQYLLDHVLVDLMEKFWIRFSQQTRGLTLVRATQSQTHPSTHSQTHQPTSSKFQRQPEVGFKPSPLDTQLNSVEYQSQVLDPQNILNSQVFSSHILAGTTAATNTSAVDVSASTASPIPNYLMSKAAQAHGSYLKVDVALMNTTSAHTDDDSMNPIQIHLENNFWKISLVKVRPIPTKQCLARLVQEVYKALSHFLEAIPNLRDHPLVSKGTLQKPKVDLSEDELERLQSQENNANSRYFINLKMSSILASPSLFTLAVKCMHQVRHILCLSLSLSLSLSFSTVSLSSLSLSLSLLFSTVSLLFHLFVSPLDP
jgi:hypothetical protein